MSRKPCAACGNEVRTVDLVLSDRGEICKSCEIDEMDLSFNSSASSLKMVIWVGFIFGFLPFFVNHGKSTHSMASGSLSFSLTTTRMGCVPTWSLRELSIDYFAIGAGIAVLLMAAWFLMLAKTSPLSFLKRTTLVGAFCLLGVLQLLRGLAIIA